jgi:hypothetical protein
MRFGLIFVSALLVQPLFANAQQLAENMTCQQAKAYFEAHGVIYKSVHGSVIPITRGIPISRSGSLICTGRYSNQFTYSLQTRDSRRCTISTYCSGTYRLLR